MQWTITSAFLDHDANPIVNLPTFYPLLLCDHNSSLKVVAPSPRIAQGYSRRSIIDTCYTSIPSALSCLNVYGVGITIP